MLLKLLTLLTLTLIQACDPNLEMSLSRISSSPVASVQYNSDGYSAAFEPEITIASEYEKIFWQKLEGPGNLFFSNATTLKPLIYADTPGEYIVTATVKHNQLAYVLRISRNSFDPFSIRVNLKNSKQI